MAGLLATATLPGTSSGPMYTSPSPLPTSTMSGTKGIGTVPVTGESPYINVGGVVMAAPRTSSFGSPAAQIARAQFGSAVQAAQQASLGQSTTPVASPSGVSPQRNPAGMLRSQGQSDLLVSAGIPTRPNTDLANPDARDREVSQVNKQLPFGVDHAQQGFIAGLKNWNYTQPMTQWSQPQLRDITSSIQSAHTDHGQNWNKIAVQLQGIGVNAGDVPALLRMSGVTPTPEERRQDAGFAYQTPPDTPHWMPRKSSRVHPGPGGIFVDDSGREVDANGIPIPQVTFDKLGRPVPPINAPASGQPGIPHYRKPGGISVRYDKNGNIVSDINSIQP